MPDKRNRATEAEPGRRWGAWLKPSLVTASVVTAAFVGFYWLLVWFWQPANGVGASNLGSVLEAQAAMTAISLAAMVFIVEAVQRREGLDDPLYELFLGKSWARWIFATAVWLLIGTALIYVLGPITHLLGELADARGDVMGICSLIVAAVLVLAFLLNALRVLRPEQYRALRREAVLEQVHRGAQSRAQARATQPVDERVRRALGVLNDPEVRATRAIERVVDQAHQAVEHAQLTEIREGMAILEDACMLVLEEQEASDYERPSLNAPSDRLWLGHDNVLSGIQRMVRTAADGVANEAVLWTIFRADVHKASTFLVTPSRLGENIASGNELFVQVMLECLRLERQAVLILADADSRLGLETAFAEMLSDALRGALSASSTSSDDTRENRIARRVLASIFDLASRSALDRSEKQACALLECFFRNADVAILATESEPKYSEPILAALRQATLSAIGYGVGVGNHEFLDDAARWLEVDKLVGSGGGPQVLALIERDVSEWSGGEPMLSAGLLWLATSIDPRSKPLETASDVERAKVVCLVLGYMWLLGVVHDAAGSLDLPKAVRPQFDHVWQLHGMQLVAALNRAGGVGGGRNVRTWCEIMFIDRDADSDH